MNIRTTIKRVEILADHMDTVIPIMFNFSMWGTKGFKPGKTCGTVGCAIGHATTMPYFYDLGLRLYQARGDITVWPVFVKHRKIQASWMHAVQRIFGGSIELLNELFLPYHGPDNLNTHSTPQQWAAQARKIAKRLREKHGIPEPKRQPQSSLQEQKSNQAGWRGLLETPRNLTNDRLGGAVSKYTPNGQSACSAKQS